MRTLGQQSAARSNGSSPSACGSPRRIVITHRDGDGAAGAIGPRAGAQRWPNASNGRAAATAIELAIGTAVDALGVRRRPASRACGRRDRHRPPVPGRWSRVASGGLRSTTAVSSKPTIRRRSGPIHGPGRCGSPDLPSACAVDLGRERRSRPSPATTRAGPAPGRRRQAGDDDASGRGLATNGPGPVRRQAPTTRS